MRSVLEPLRRHTRPRASEGFNDPLHSATYGFRKSMAFCTRRRQIGKVGPHQDGTLPQNISQQIKNEKVDFRTDRIGAL